MDNSLSAISTSNRYKDFLDQVEFLCDSKEYNFQNYGQIDPSKRFVTLTVTELRGILCEAIRDKIEPVIVSYENSNYCHNCGE